MTNLVYPNLDEVETADRVQLAKWLRFLHSPGIEYAGTPDFSMASRAEGFVLQRIIERFNSTGGWTPELSIQIGWDKTKL